MGERLGHDRGPVMSFTEIFIDARHDALMQDHGRFLVYNRHDAVV